MPREPIDVEALLVWAYRDQCVDRASGQDWGLGRPVDSIVRCERLMGASLAAGHDCHPDAEMVHAAVLRLSKAQIGLVISHAKCGDRPGWGEGMRLVMAAKVTQRGNPVRLYDANRNLIGHEVRAAVEMPGGALFYAPANRNPLQWYEKLVQDERLGWMLWHAGMVGVAGFLRDGGLLAGYEVNGPAATATPWVVPATTSDAKAA
jgi:hypothetical protein